uniref:DUF7660 family protein n=1 Tax=Pseudonocardia sp. CA-138482 TaxID=3240023 RepID=UPI003F49757D
MNLEDSVQYVTSRAELARFVDKFADSLVEEPEMWENTSLESFLRAWSAWLSSMDGAFRNRGLPVPEQPTWNLIADMFMAARIYE